MIRRQKQARKLRKSLKVTIMANESIINFKKCCLNFERLFVCLLSDSVFANVCSTRLRDLF